jgi:hypothetical protein
MRADPAAAPPGRAILVARVALAPDVAGDLLEDLGARWEEFARGILPKELFDEETED